MYRELVDKANARLRRATTTMTTAKAPVNLSDDYKSITLSAIEYKATIHSLAEHVDHDDNWVYLLSLGCVTNFVVQGPNMAEKQSIRLYSGDLMVFDASTRGNILHGITSIEAACPPGLVDCFPVLQHHRYGIQLRVRF